jgi:hypothetical protein
MWCEGAKGLGAGQSGTEPMDKDMDTIADKARWTIIARRALLGAAILIAASQTALAAPTTLVCRRNGSLGADVFTLNEAQRTVTIAFAASQNNDGSVSPARSPGPLSATFTDNSITISHDHRYYGYSSTDTGIIDTYVINRVAATVELTNVYNNGVVGHAEWTCHVGKKQF